MTNRVAHILSAAVVTAAAFALAACSDHRTFSPSGYAPIEASRADRFAGVAPAQAAPANAQTRLAVTHSFSLALPNSDVEAAQRKHLDECARLGCTVLSTRLDRSNEGRVYARTSVRIKPESYDTFANALAAAPVRIVSHSQSTEDKTLPLLDVEKRVEVKSALRDRLLAMLKDPGTKTAADLLAIEKELSQVQGDIETAIAQRDYLRTITDTVRVDIAYEGLVAQVGGVDLSPVKRATTAFGETAVASLANLIYVLAALLPWIPLLVLLAWGMRRGFRRWRARTR